MYTGMLAAHYAAARTPVGLKRLVIANSLASIELYKQGSASLIARFPTEIQENIRKHEAAGTYDSAEYQEGVNLFMKKHVCTLDPWPQELLQSFQVYEDNKTVYRSMYVGFQLPVGVVTADGYDYLCRFGRSEFTIDGNLKDWDIVDILHKIPYPTLLISAPEDEAQEVAVLPFFLEIPKIKWVELQNSTHLGMFEEPERYCSISPTVYVLC